MCGISGLITKNYSYKELFEDINLMRNEISHRGPDYSDAWIDTELGISFAHNRLSIVDLSSSGNQPMKSKNGNLIISFNGEIYNYKEIKEFLNKEFVDNSFWNGTSDTEVLLTAIEFLGLNKTLELVRGMFAFALYNKENREIILVRDRFGEKPLYWGFVKNKNNNSRNIVFGSELKAFKALKYFDNNLSNKGIMQYLNYGYISAPLSIYENIFQLPPGNLIRISQNKFIENYEYQPEPENWYKFLDKESAKLIDKSDHEITIHLENLLIKSISDQNNADVPICTFLSGGIDSSIVATLLQKIRNEKINTLTISFPDYDESSKFFNEGPFASRIAKHLGTNHNDIPITSKEALEIIPKMSEIYSEPFSDSSQIATYLLCKATKESSYKVALTGDGADELFGGYNRHIFLPKIYKLFGKAPQKLNKIIALLIEKIPLSEKGLAKDKRQKLSNIISNSKNIESSYEGLLNLWFDKKNHVLKKEFYSDLKKDITLPMASTISERIMLKDLIDYLPSDILVKTDRASMANSIETRCPFLDHEIAEFSRLIPLSLKSNSKNFSRSGKVILKNILGKYIPEELFLRPKSGFSVPIGQWLKSSLKDWANELLSENKIKKQGYLDYKIIKKLWESHLSNKYDYTPQLWCILMWQSWLENN